MVQETGDKDLDRIPIVDPELEKERRARQEAERQSRLNNPTIDKLSPVDPLTGKPAEILPGRPKGSGYPGSSQPRPMPMGGAKDD